MDRRNKKSEQAGKTIPPQIIFGEDGAPAFAVVPIAALRRWLKKGDGFALRKGMSAEQAADVAAYDAAKARAEESFPSGVADRLIAKESPIKVFREHRNLSQSGLAKAAKTSAAYLSQIETGRRTGSVKLLRRLAEALRVGLDDLV